MGIDLNTASTSFTATLNDMNHCSNEASQMCVDEIKDKITTLLILDTNDSNRIEVQSVSQASESAVSARIKIVPQDNSRGRMLRQSRMWSKGTTSNTHSVGLFKKLQQKAVENQGKTRALATSTSTSDGEFLPGLGGGTILDVSNMKILPGDLDEELFSTDPEMIQEEEELYRYGSSKADSTVSHLVMSKVEMQAIVEEMEKKEWNMIEEIDIKSKNREDIMMNEMKKESKSREEIMMKNLFRELKENRETSQAELKTLRVELMVVSFACICISLFAFLSLKR